MRRDDMGFFGLFGWGGVELGRVGLNWVELG